MTRRSLHRHHVSVLSVSFILILSCQGSSYCGAFIPSSISIQYQHQHQYDQTYCSSSVALYASKKSKKNKATKSSPRSGGGGGFGSPKSTTTSNKNRPESPQTSVYKHEAPPELQTRIPKPNQQQFQEEQEETALPGTTAAKRRQQKRQKWSEAVEEQAEERSSLSAETHLLQTLYTRDYQKQELLNALSVPRKLIQISTNPLLFTMDDFIDPELCRRVTSDGAGCFDLLFPETLSDHLFGGQESEMDGLLFNVATSQDHDEAAPKTTATSSTASSNYPDGLHVDTNGQCLFRHVTAILYLNDIPEECGGATVFPVARALPQDPALAAAKRLIQEKVPHTRSRSVQLSGLEADAQLLELRMGTQFTDDMTTNTVIKIQPKAGRLLIFFSRDASGHQDPRAWHAGERLLPGKDGLVTEKRILTLFKEVDYSGSSEDHSQVQTTFEGFLAPLVSQQRELLQERAGSY